MCSSQTGCTSYSPTILVKRLSNEELHQYVLQYKDGDKSNQSRNQEIRERLSSLGKCKKKQRNVKLPSAKSCNTNKSLTESSCSKSDDRILRGKNITCSIEEGTRNSVCSKSLSKTKLTKRKEPPNKKYSRRYSLTNQNVHKRAQNKTKNSCIEKNIIKLKNVPNISSDNSIKTKRNKRYSTPPPIIQSCSNENESDSDSDDAKVTEEIIRNIFQILPIKEEKDIGLKKRMLTRPIQTDNLINKNKTLSIIQTDTTTVPSENRYKRNISNGDSESQSEVKCRGLIKLKSPRSLGIVNQNESDMMDCSKTLKIIDSLIIDDSMVGKLCLLYRQYFNEYVKSLICCLIKSLEAMLLELARNDILKDFVHKTGNEVFDNFSSIEKMVDNELAQPTIKHNVELANFSCENMLIDDTFVQPPFKENVELNNSPGGDTTENIDVQPAIQQNVKLSDDKIFIQKVLEYLTFNISQLDSKEFAPTLKSYSKDFVLTFTMISDKFDEDDKKKMIPIVYLYVLKHFENSSQLKQECLWNVILKLFEIEKYSCKHDGVSFKPWKQMEIVFSIYERWLNNSKVDLSRELINPQYQVNLEGVELDLDLLNYNKNNVLSDVVSSVPQENISEAQRDLNLDFLNYNKNNVLSDVVSSVPQDNISEAQGDLAIDKDLDSDNNDLFEESINKICTENKISQILELQITDTVQDCLNDWCGKKLKVPCFYCKNLVSCQELCQVNEDQIFSAILSEKKLVSCNLHKNIIKNYILDEKCDSMLDCVNSFCTKKLSVPCAYCMELVACEDLCQVNEDQYINIETEEYTWILVSCKAHKDGSSNYIEVIKLEEHDMPYEPLCWRPKCAKRSLIVCVCKTRSYCSDICQKEDWFSCHYKDCNRWPQPDLTL